MAFILLLAEGERLQADHAEGQRVLLGLLATVLIRVLINHHHEHLQLDLGLRQAVQLMAVDTSAHSLGLGECPATFLAELHLVAE